MTSATNTSRYALTIDKGVPRQLFNRLVARMLRSRLHHLAGFSRFSMLLSYSGKRSGKQYTLPLAYMRDGDIVTTFALFSNTIWWKNLQGGAPVTLRLQGRDYQGVANVDDDPHAVADGLLRMAASSPRMTQRGYYAIPRMPDGAVDRARLLEAARTRVMIEIRVTGRTTPPSRALSRRMKALMRLVVGTHVLVYRATGGRVWGRIGPVPVLLLTTIGRKSGKRLTIPLNYYADGTRYVVVGAMGGAPKSPGWVFNLQANPQALVQVGPRRQEMRATVVQGDERDRLWSLLRTQFPPFDEMQQRTSRPFPIVVLVPA